MRCISFVIFLTFSSCFVVLPALENITQAGEIEFLERKLEYLRAKKELDLELEIVKAKLQKLNQDYSDVVDTKTAVSASSTSESPETSEPSAPAKVEEAPTKAAQGADHEWVATYGYCGIHKEGFKDIKIDEDGAFSLIMFYEPNPNEWDAFIKGNLRRNEAEMVKDKSNTQGDILGSIKAEQDGEAWKLTITLLGGGGRCYVKTVITRK